MSLERKIFIVDDEPRSASENLAINEVIAQDIEAGKYDAVGRIYTHKPALILARQGAHADINLDYCRKQGLEIVHRPSSGSTVIVNPETTLCYSLFTRVGKDIDVPQWYSNITESMAQQLGEPFKMQGTYYLMAPHSDGKHYPFAGHAMHVKNRVMRFGGIVNKTSFDMGTLASAIKLRELYRGEDGEQVIRMNGSFYCTEGKKKARPDHIQLVTREHDILSRVQGLQELGIEETVYMGMVKRAFEKQSGPLRYQESVALDPERIAECQREILQRGSGWKEAGGHCFVEFQALEQEEVYYRAQA